MTQFFVIPPSLYNFLKRMKIDFLFYRLGRILSSFLFSLFHLSLSSASSTVRFVQFHLFLSLTAFFVYFICFFLRLLTSRPNIRDLSPLSFEDIHHPSTQIFNKTSTATVTQPLLSLALCLPCCV